MQKNRVYYVGVDAGTVLPQIFGTLSGVCNALNVSYQTACRGRRKFRRKFIMECEYVGSRKKGGTFKRTEEEERMKTWRNNTAFDEDI